ncbi:LPS export ABC transporter periplasmic protein LptC [Cognatishimia sp.]
MIAWLKILLPLAALVLLSTLFLFARPSNPIAALPFAQVEIEEKLRSQGITEPYFAGQTPAGDQIAMRAASARPDPEALHLVNSVDVAVDITMQDGGSARFASKSAVVNTDNQVANLEGDVEINSTAGFDLHTEKLTLDLLEGRAQSDVIVHGSGPFGTFEAGSMLYSGDTAAQNAQFRFDNGVKLIYMPSRN